MADTMREEFEKWELETNSPVFLQRSDEEPDEYGNWIVQEQWVSWQAAHEAGRQLGMEQARAELAKTSEAVVHCIVRLDGRAMMEGSNACSVRWGFDSTRVREYPSAEAANQSIEVCCDDDDGMAFAMPASVWAALAERGDAGTGAALARMVIDAYYSDEPSAYSIEEAAWEILRQVMPGVVQRTEDLREKAGMPPCDALGLALSEAPPPQPAAERVALSDERVDDLLGEANRGFCIEREDYFKAFRDAERAHGITAGTTEQAKEQAAAAIAQQRGSGGAA